MSTRFPRVCLRCASLDHYAEDCKRMPAGMGMSQQERDMVQMVSSDRKAVLLAAGAFIASLIVEKFV